MATRAGRVFRRWPPLHPPAHPQVHCTPVTTPVKALNDALDGLFMDLDNIEQQCVEQLEQTKTRDD